MANSIPMWWMRSNRCRQPCQPEPPKPPEPAQPAAPPQLLLHHAAAPLTGRLQQKDPETVLLLALLLLLWQEHADRKLLLALAYIIL